MFSYSVLKVKFYNRNRYLYGFLLILAVNNDPPLGRPGGIEPTSNTRSVTAKTRDQQWTPRPGWSAFLPSWLSPRADPFFVRKGPSCGGPASPAAPDRRRGGRRPASATAPNKAKLPGAQVRHARASCPASAEVQDRGAPLDLANPANITRMRLGRWWRRKRV